MDDNDLCGDLGMLCLCCDYHSYEIPDIEGLSAVQRKQIEELCKLCIDNSARKAVNS